MYKFGMIWPTYAFVYTKTPKIHSSREYKGIIKRFTAYHTTLCPGYWILQCANYSVYSDSALGDSMLNL